MLCVKRKKKSDHIASLVIILESRIIIWHAYMKLKDFLCSWFILQLSTFRLNEYFFSRRRKKNVQYSTCTLNCEALFSLSSLRILLVLPFVFKVQTCSSAEIIRQSLIIFSTVKLYLKKMSEFSVFLFNQLVTFWIDFLVQINASKVVCRL